MPSPTRATTCRVRAEGPGYSNGHRRAGEEFTFAAGPSGVLPRWLTPLDPPAKADPPPPADALGMAIAALDPTEDAHWTKAGGRGEGGRPNLMVLSETTGARVTRSMVEAAAPGFTRDVAHKAAKNAAVSGVVG